MTANKLPLALWLEYDRMRSHAVTHFLVEKGRFDPSRVVCEAHGEFHPADPSNKAKNRRVEIVVAN